MYVCVHVYITCNTENIKKNKIHTKYIKVLNYVVHKIINKFLFKVMYKL